jgi:hypothetical protein
LDALNSTYENTIFLKIPLFLYLTYKICKN